jgi:hypothetical protein
MRWHDGGYQDAKGGKMQCGQLFDHSHYFMILGRYDLDVVDDHGSYFTTRHYLPGATISARYTTIYHQYGNRIATQKELL